MQINRKTVETFVTVRVPETGKETIFRVTGRHTMTMLDPDTRKDRLAVTVAGSGEVTVTPIDGMRWPEDAAKCLLECSRDCNGDLLCVTACAALCSTIIVG